MDYRLVLAPVKSKTWMSISEVITDDELIYCLRYMAMDIDFDDFAFTYDDVQPVGLNSDTSHAPEFLQKPPTPFLHYDFNAWQEPRANQFVLPRRSAGNHQSELEDGKTTVVFFKVSGTAGWGKSQTKVQQAGRKKKASNGRGWRLKEVEPTPLRCG